jgi:hypothetical protein
MKAKIVIFVLGMVAPVVPALPKAEVGGLEDC